MKTQRCSKTYWWKVKGLGFSALKDSYIRGPGEGCALLSSFPAAKSFPVLPAAAWRSWEREAAYLSPINGRSVRPWNGAASFPVTETLMIFIFFFPGGSESEWRKMRRKRAWFFRSKEPEGGTYVSVIIENSLFRWSLNGFFRRLFECLSQPYWKCLCFEAGALPHLFMSNIAFKNSIT